MTPDPTTPTKPRDEMALLLAAGWTPYKVAQYMTNEVELLRNAVASLLDGGENPWAEGHPLHDVVERATDPEWSLDNPPSAAHYDGPEPSVKCAWPPCMNHLQRSHLGGDQWCSKEHRALSEIGAEPHSI